MLMIYFIWFADQKKQKICIERLKKQLFGPVGDYSEPQISKPKKKKKPKFNKSEERCREIFEDIFDAKFKSIRPNWLKNPVTGQNLELDGFSPSIKTSMGQGIAFEYDGIQHAEYNKHFHRNGPAEFIYQTKKDSWKDLKCKENGVFLIRIPHFVASPRVLIRNPATADSRTPKMNDPMTTATNWVVTSTSCPLAFIASRKAALIDE